MVLDIDENLDLVDGRDQEPKLCLLLEDAVFSDSIRPFVSVIESLGKPSFRKNHYYLLEASLLVSLNNYLNIHYFRNLNTPHFENLLDQFDDDKPAILMLEPTTEFGKNLKGYLETVFAYIDTELYGPPYKILLALNRKASKGKDLCTSDKDLLIRVGLEGIFEHYNWGIMINEDGNNDLFNLISKVLNSKGLRFTLRTLRPYFNDHSKYIDGLNVYKKDDILRALDTVIP